MNIVLNSYIYKNDRFKHSNFSNLTEQVNRNTTKRRKKKT